MFRGLTTNFMVDVPPYSPGGGDGLEAGRQGALKGTLPAARSLGDHRVSSLRPSANARAASTGLPPPTRHKPARHENRRTPKSV